jgi:hypothetical protein
MDYKLERKIRLNESPKHQSLYGWCLNEIGEDGKSQGDEVTWPWSFSFTSASLRLHRGIEVKCVERDAKSVETSNSRSITADLFSGICTDGENLKDRVNFKMFGTDRSIEKFDLCILPVDSVEEEGCSIYASPSYDYEVDFKHGTTDDTVVINLNINKEKFDEFAKAIELKSVDFIGVRVGGISGFYSHWSPSISTGYIKVLTEYHQVEGSDTSQVQIFRAGNVNDFSISLHTINELNIKPNFESINFYKKFRELGFDSVVEPLERQKDQNVHDDPAVFQNKQSILYSKFINSLKLPLWLIFLILFLMLIK